MYVLKVRTEYFTGVGLSASQTEAKRFASTERTALDSAVVLLFGDGTRFVKLRPRATN